MIDTHRGGWRPDPATVRGANLTVAMNACGFGTYEDFHRWSVADRPGFWAMTVDRLGGIKISSAEIERTISGIEGVAEVAAVGVTREGGGPCRLVVYTVPAAGAEPDPEGWKHAMQRKISENLNPLLRIEDVAVIDELPRTASAKVMRRELRTRYR